MTAAGKTSAVTEAAFELDFIAFFRSEFESIVRAVYFIVNSKDGAIEIAQDAFVKAYIRWNKVSRYDKPGAWVRRVAIRQAVRDKKRSARQTELVDSSAIFHEDHDQYLDLRRAISRLTPAQRAAIVLHYYYDYPVAEVANLMGCRASTAKVHLHQARASLQQLLAVMG